MSRVLAKTPSIPQTPRDEPLPFLEGHDDVLGLPEPTSIQSLSLVVPEGLVIASPQCTEAFLEVPSLYPESKHVDNSFMPSAHEVKNQAEAKWQEELQGASRGAQTARPGPGATRRGLDPKTWSSFALPQAGPEHRRPESSWALVTIQAARVLWDRGSPRTERSAGR